MSVKEDLNKLITDVKLKRFQDNAGKDIVKNIEKELVDAMKPVLRDLASSVGQSVRQAISQVQVSTPNVTLNPTFTVPDIEVPEAKVTITNPPIRIPDIKMPDKMNIEGWVGLMGVSLEKPLPVQLRNPDGSPFNMVENLNVFGGGSGGMRHVIVDNFSQIGGSGGLTDTELRATSVPVSQVSGAQWSTSATITNTTLAVTQSGTWDEVGINDSGNSITVDGTISVSGSITSVVATGAVLHDAADDGHAPVKLGGHAIQTNPAAVADGDIVRLTADDLGRQITRPVQVRDLIFTAYISLTGGTETTLLAASAGAYHDLIYIMGTNNSDAAVTCDIRSVTAGNIMTSIRIPANGTAGVSLPVPLPQDATGNNWTADLPDVSGTTVTLSALFSREV